MHGLGAIAHNRMVGLAHYVLHQSSSPIADTCGVQVVPENTSQCYIRFDRHKVCRSSMEPASMIFSK